jgi:hypothetical protein
MEATVSTKDLKSKLDRKENITVVEDIRTGALPRRKRTGAARNVFSEE